MKKSYKILLFSVLGVILALFCLFMFVNVAGIPSYENEAEDLLVEITEERVTEGARMAAILCIQCHGSKDGLLGGSPMDDVTIFGEVYAPNITQHPQLGITDYTDGELAYLLRSGIRKDGQYVPPWMPKFPHLSDEDLYSIIAFLRSDHPLVQPSDNQLPEIKPSFLTKMLSRTPAFRPLTYPEGKVEAPPREDKVAYGKYLVDSKFDCFSCHSANFKKVDIMNPENSEGYLGGGNQFFDKEMNEIYSPNLTMDKETGLGSWTEEEFIKTLRFGMRPDNTPLRFPMVPAPMITPEEAAAMWSYLQTVPVIVNEVE
jgi:mono/diheme cytochrome c family protein